MKMFKMGIIAGVLLSACSSIALANEYYPNMTHTTDPDYMSSWNYASDNYRKPVPDYTPPVVIPEDTSYRNYKSYIPEEYNDHRKEKTKGSLGK